MCECLHNLKIETNSETESNFSGTGQQMSRSSNSLLVLTEKGKLSEATSPQILNIDENSYLHSQSSPLRERDCPRTKKSGFDCHSENCSIMGSNGEITVKGVVISEFSPTERLQFFQRSQINVHKDLVQNKLVDFCINI